MCIQVYMTLNKNWLLIAEEWIVCETFAKTGLSFYYTDISYLNFEVYLSNIIIDMEKYSVNRPSIQIVGWSRMEVRVC
jgi:hypothetical protein